jgi:hypothetical protein
VQQAGDRIARKISCEPGNRILGAFSHSSCPLRRKLFQLFESFPQAYSVERIYGKHSDTTLRAPGMTDQPLAASVRCIREGGINDLN